MGDEPSVFLVVLGIAQDGGVPHAGCLGECCREAWRDPSQRRLAASLGLADPATGETWLLDASPDFPEQHHRLQTLDEFESPARFSGILLTHAHVGHYAGLIHLGREGMGARGLPVHAMPRMEAFLRENAPWSQLVSLGNISIRTLRSGRATSLNTRLHLTPFPVPHRDEFSETVGFRIEGPARSILYLPDIDGWEEWERLGTRVEEMLAGVDRAYVDGTFFDESELPGRTAAEIPHPLVSRSLEKLGRLPAPERDKVRFIHLNHTNPALLEDSEKRRRIESAGFHVAREGERFEL